MLVTFCKFSARNRFARVEPCISLNIIDRSLLGVIIRTDVRKLAARDAFTRVPLESAVLSARGNEIAQPRASFTNISLVSGIEKILSGINLALACRYSTASITRSARARALSLVFSRTRSVRSS